MGHDRPGGQRLVLIEQRVGDACGKAAIGGVVNADDLERCAGGCQRLGQRVEAGASRAMTCIDQEFHGSERGQIDEFHQLGHIGRAAGADIGDAPTGAGGREIAAFGQILDRGHAIGLANRGRAAFDHLHPVVIHRVVAGGDADPAIRIQMGGGEIGLFRSRKAQIQHCDARIAQAAGHGIGQALRAGAHIAAQHHAGRPHHLGIGAADAIGDVAVQLGLKPATDIIGFETA